ncbi:glycosyltransferase [Mesorhizobium waimense]|nr:glycosyltransferase [Mesorhizobium waimense]
MPITRGSSARSARLPRSTRTSTTSDDAPCRIERVGNYVFPSNQRSEAYGLSLVEAAMCGKPMISCELGTGTSYVNKAGKTGLVVPPSDPTRLAEAINRFVDSPVETANWGRAARDRYVRLFTADRMGKSYAELYCQLDSRRR